MGFEQHAHNNHQNQSKQDTHQRPTIFQTYLEALAVVFLASGLVAGAALDMQPLLSRHYKILRQQAGLRVEPQLGVLLHEGSPVLPVPAAHAVAGVRAEKLALEALAVAATARTTEEVLIVSLTEKTQKSEGRRSSPIPYRLRQVVFLQLQLGLSSLS
jgi:hypothetical protein